MPHTRIVHRYIDVDEYERALVTQGIVPTPNEIPRPYQSSVSATVPLVHSGHDSYAAVQAHGLLSQMAAKYKIEEIDGSLFPEVQRKDMFYAQHDKQYWSSWQGSFGQTKCCSSTDQSARFVSSSLITPHLVPESLLGQNNQHSGSDAHDFPRWSYSVSDYPRELRESIALNEILSESIILSCSDACAQRSLMTPPPFWNETASTDGQVTGPLFPPGYEHLLPDSRPVSASFEDTAYRLASPIEISMPAGPFEIDTSASKDPLSPSGTGMRVTIPPPPVSPPPSSSQSLSPKRARHKHSSPPTPRKSSKETTSRTTVYPTGKFCLDCRTTSTPLWRKDGKGGIFCNKCGIRRSRAKSRGSIARPANSQSADIAAKTVMTAAYTTTAAPVDGSVSHTPDRGEDCVSSVSV